MLPLSQLQGSSKGKGFKKRSYSGYDKAEASAENPFAGARVPPQDLESEKALIGSLLLSSDALFDIADLINPQSFYAVKHQIIYEAIEELVNQKEPVDILTVSAALRAKKVFDQVGGAPYLSDLLGLVGSAANIKYYAQIIRKKELLRKLIEGSNHIAELSYQEEVSRSLSVSSLSEFLGS